MGETVNNGEPKKSQSFRILVLLPAGDVNSRKVKDKWRDSFAAKYKDFDARVDFCTVRKAGMGKPLPIVEFCTFPQIDDNNTSSGKFKTLNCDDAPSATGEVATADNTLFDPVKRGYRLGIAYGDWLNDWINGNTTLTPSDSQKKATLPFILITTKPKVNEPHLKAYPSEGLVGMLLARLMDEAKAPDRYNLEATDEWRAFFYEETVARREFGDSDTEKVVGCREAFEENVKDLGLDSRGGVIPFDDNTFKDITFDDKKVVTKNKAFERFKEKYSGVKLFCAYAASAPDATAYDTIVRAINSLGSENDKKILVTDACWDVPKECTNLRIAQLCGMQSQTENGELLVGSKLFCWLIPTLLELVLKTVKYEAAKSEQKQSITELITTIGPLMSVQGTTFSFVGQEMFIPFSFSYYSWVASNGGGRQNMI